MMAHGLSLGGAYVYQATPMLELRAGVDLNILITIKPLCLTTLRSISILILILMPFLASKDKTYFSASSRL